MIGVGAAAERARFAVAVARVQLARLDEVAARVQAQRGYLVVAGVRFQLVEQPRAEPAPPGGGHDEHAGDLADPAGQQAQAGAAEHGAVLDRHQQQAAGRGQVVARLLPHGRRDLLVGGRAAVVPAGDLGEVGPQDLARRGGRRRHDRDDRVGIPHPSSMRYGRVQMGSEAEAGADPGGHLADGVVGFGGAAGRHLEGVQHAGEDVELVSSPAFLACSSRLRASSSSVSSPPTWM